MSNFSLAADVKEEVESDVISTGRKFTWDTGIYDCTLKLAYLTKAKSGADAVNFVLAHDGQEITQTIYVTSGMAKGNKPTWTVTEKHGKSTKDRYGVGAEVPLPGFSQVNSIIKMAVDSDLAECDSNKQKKFVKIYNENTKVEVLMDLVNVPITLAIQEIRQNKSELINGSYKPTNDERVINEIVKVLTPEHFTKTEAAKGIDETIWATDWAGKFSGKVKDEFKEVKGAGKAGMPTGSKPSTDLDFDD